MHQLVTTIETLQLIKGLLTTNQTDTAILAIEGAIEDAQADVDEYENWAEREMLAEAAWQAHGADLENEIPF